MTHYRHIIWDWNGTLFDDAWLWYELVNVQFAKHKKAPIDFDHYRRTIMFPAQQFFLNAGIELDATTFGHLADEMHQHYAERRLECTLHGEIEALLKKVTMHGLTQSILSAHPQEMLDFIVSHLKVHSHFSDIIGHRDNRAAGKVALAKEWIETHATPKENILFVGDTDHDAEVAQAIGVHCVLISHGYQDPEKLLKTGAPVVHSVEELSRKIGFPKALA